MAHVPKRATQHGIFMSGSETSPPALKPGQNELHRQDLYITESKPWQEPYLFQDQFNDSHYTKSIARVTLPEDYEDPTKPCKPPTITAGCDPGGTEHWKSEYRAALNEAKSEEAEFGRPYFPPEFLDDAHHFLGRSDSGSTYQDEFGRSGTNPRDKIGMDLEGMNLKKAMDAGTTKGTKHMPGYQGFIPGNTFSEEVARVERGDFKRSVDKTNIEQTFHVNLIGYSGHEPKSACNDRGGRHHTVKTVYGHDFPDPHACEKFAALGK